MDPLAGGQIQQRHSKCSLAWLCTADAAGQNKSDIGGEAQLGLWDGNHSQPKVLDFLHCFNWKCGDHKQAGITEIMWPSGGNPQTAVSVIFLHLPSRPGCRQRPICFKSSTSNKKKKISCPETTGLPAFARHDDLSSNEDQRGPDFVHLRMCHTPIVNPFSLL